MQDNQKQAMLAQRELMLATQLAKMRDDFRWLCAFHGTLGTALLLRGMSSHNPAFLAPFIPMGFSLAYLYDAAYGDKFYRIMDNAEEILAKDRGRFMLPAGNALMSPEDYAVKIMGVPLKKCF